MRSSLLLTLCLAALFQLTLAAKKPVVSSAERNAKWSKVSASNNHWIDLASTSDFDELLATPREYSVSVLLTSTGKTIHCQPCQDFQPEYEYVARGWAKDKNSSRHLFSKLEFERGKDVFERLKLQHAPVLMYFPATAGPFAAPPGKQDAEQYDFNNGFEADAVADFHSNVLGTKVTFSKPLPWHLIIPGSIVAGLIVGGVVYFAPRLNITAWSGSKAIWQIISLGTIVVMCSGYMFNQIRSTPFLRQTSEGRLEYIAGGFQNQHGIETNIVAFIYSLLAFSFVALCLLVPKQRDPARQRAGVYLWSGIFLGTFSALFVIFRMKNPSYPFRLFL